MKNIINYYYNLFPNEIISQNNFFYFWIENEKFYFAPFNNDKKKVWDIYQKLLLERKKTNEIILNKDGDIVTFFNNKEYTLLRINCIENEIVNFESFYNIKMDDKPVDWGNVWSNKIDYLEYQVNQRALGKDNILNSFSYYVGLAENAIQYFNMLDLKDATVSIQHKRVYADNYEINYYNPINMIVDYDVRDLSEFIKFSFFSNKFSEDKVINFINALKLNRTMMNLLYARLIFPTYYLDHYEKLLNDEEDEEKLMKILEKVDDYEFFLKKFYLYYGKSHNLLKVDWLVDVKTIVNE